MWHTSPAQVKMPIIRGLTWAAVERESNGPFLLKARSHGLELKGQMLCTTTPVPGE